MGDLYASAVGTTILQLKEIPPRPEDYVGQICLFGSKKAMGPTEEMYQQKVEVEESATESVYDQNFSEW